MAEHCCQVSQVAAKQSIRPAGLAYSSLDKYLLARWRGDDALERDDCDQLASWFNRSVLSQRYERAGRDRLSAEVLTDYYILSGNDTEDYQTLVAELTEDGLDPDAIRNDFVSAHTVESHLRECLDEELPIEKHDQQLDQRVQQLRSQVKADVKDICSSASEVIVSSSEGPQVEDTVIVLSCPRCSTTTTLEEAVENGYVCETHYPL